ncbi:hypothetical protein ACWCXH_08115 [Kitasatospora sp. NPDC001660]
MQLSGFTKGALVLAGLCALTAPAAAGCGPSAPRAPRHPADQLIDAGDVPPGFTRSGQSVPESLGCPALDEALRATGEQATVDFRSDGDHITERITATAGTPEAGAVLKAVAASVHACPSSGSTRDPATHVITGEVRGYATLAPLPSAGDGSVVVRANQGTGPLVFSTELMVIRQGATVVELRHEAVSLSKNADIPGPELAGKALAHLG